MWYTVRIFSERTYVNANYTARIPRFKQMKRTLTTRRSTPAKPVNENTDSRNSRPVALTLKVNDETYLRLCMLKATQRRTSQEILHEALNEYLYRSETERRQK